MPVRHIVCWQLTATEPAEAAKQAAAIRAALEGLRGRLPGLLAIDVGREIDPRDGQYDVVLNALFTDAAALQSYQSSALHAAAVQSMVGMTSARACVDYLV